MAQIRVSVEGWVHAAIRVPHTMHPDRLIWKAQVKVNRFRTKLHRETVTLASKVEITYPIEPTIGQRVRFTANLNNGKELSNPRGIAFETTEREWIRVGG